MNEIAIDQHEVSRSKGWWDDVSPAACAVKKALIHSEISEALECVRDDDMEVRYTETGKPEGFPVEVADVLLRTLDLAYVWGTSVKEPTRRTVKPTLEPIALGVQLREMHYELEHTGLNALIDECFVIAAMVGFDLIDVAEEKLEYNRTRPHRHGGRRL